MIPACVEQELKALADDGRKSELLESEGTACVVFPAYPLPRGYSKKASDLLLVLPLSYPNGKPDMFWVEPDVTLAGGAVPKSADQIEPHVGRQWRRFSWHMSSWNPATDNLRTFLEFINCRLAKGV